MVVYVTLGFTLYTFVRHPKCIKALSLKLNTIE